MVTCLTGLYKKLRTDRASGRCGGGLDGLTRDCQGETRAYDGAPYDVLPARKAVDRKSGKGVTPNHGIDSRWCH